MSGEQKLTKKSPSYTVLKNAKNKVMRILWLELRRPPKGRESAVFDASTQAAKSRQSNGAIIYLSRRDKSETRRPLTAAKTQTTVIRSPAPGESQESVWGTREIGKEVPHQYPTDEDPSPRSTKEKTPDRKQDGGLEHERRRD